MRHFSFWVQGAGLVTICHNLRSTPTHKPAHAGATTAVMMRRAKGRYAAKIISGLSAGESNDRRYGRTAVQHASTSRLPWSRVAGIARVSIAEIELTDDAPLTCVHLSAAIVGHALWYIFTTLSAFAIFASSFDPSIIAAPDSP